MSPKFCLNKFNITATSFSCAAPTPEIPCTFISAHVFGARQELMQRFRTAPTAPADNLRKEEFMRYATRAKLSAPDGSLLATLSVDSLLKEAEERQLRPRDWSPFVRRLRETTAPSSSGFGTKRRNT